MSSHEASLISIIRHRSKPFAPIPTEMNASTKPLHGIRHIAFDVYGTLLASGVGDIGNSAPADRGGALESLLKELGAQALPSPKKLEDLYLAEIQLSQEESRSKGAIQPEVEIRNVWRSYLEKAGGKAPATDEEIAEIALRFELSVNPVWPMPELVETLKTLAPRFAPFSIVSNAQFFTPLLFPALTGKSLEELHFQKTSSIWSYELREAKPSPRLFEKLLERLGAEFHPKEVLYVGNDMLNDISTAQKAGLRTALFGGDQRSLRLRKDHPDCRGVTPDLIVTNLASLPGLLA